MELDLQKLGTFDAVFYFGVLYHMICSIPALSLQRLAKVTRSLAHYRRLKQLPLPDMSISRVCEFYETNELNGDVSNWWAPNAKALAGMCRAAGFREVCVNPKRNRRGAASGSGYTAGTACRTTGWWPTH